MFWLLMFAGCVLIAISMACWIANATPMDDWRELDEIMRETEASRQAEDTAEERYTVCIADKSLQWPQVQKANSTPIADRWAATWSDTWTGRQSPATEHVHNRRAVTRSD